MALHFPTDYNVFAVVLTDHRPSAPKDIGITREVRKRIPHFIASHEDDLTLLNVLKLEQKLGKPINWVASEFTLDDFIRNDTDIPGKRSRVLFAPNRRTRFCTEYQKVRPIAEWCYLHIEIPVVMHVGFRRDEENRVQKWNCTKDKMKMPIACRVNSKRYQYTEIEWRFTHFPLYHEGIDVFDVHNYWSKQDWVWPMESNCRFCFFKPDDILKTQAERYPVHLEAWTRHEASGETTFAERSLVERITSPKMTKRQQAPCQCTD